MGSCSPPSCKRTDPICCIDPRSGALFGQSMALDRLHKVRKAGAPGMGPYPKRPKRTGRVLEQDWAETAQMSEERKQINIHTLPKTMVKWHKIIHPPATPKSYKGHTLALRQGRYYVGNHKVHIALQNKAWLGQVRASIFRLEHLEQIQAYQFLPVHSHPSIRVKQVLTIQCKCEHTWL